MSMPRRVLPGTTYLITRTTRNRRCFLTPDDTGVAIIFWFCIAVAAAMTGVEIAAVAVLSNHIHIVATDVRGELPRFLHWVFRHTAVCLKLLRGGIDENVWSTDKPDCVELLTNEAIIEAISYTLANPSTSGLLAQANTWPGAISSPEDLRGRTRVAEVPGQFFSKKWVPQRLTFHMPPCLALDFDPDDVVDVITARIRELESEKLGELRAEGRNFLGLKRVLRTRFTSRPTKPRGGPPGTSRVPSLKTVCASAMKHAIAGLRAFRTAYAEALEHWRAGGSARVEALFPAGTWWMVRFAGAEAAAPD